MLIECPACKARDAAVVPSEPKKGVCDNCLYEWPLTTATLIWTKGAIQDHERGRETARLLRHRISNQPIEVIASLADKISHPIRIV